MKNRTSMQSKISRFTVLQLRKTLVFFVGRFLEKHTRFFEAYKQCKNFINFRVKFKFKVLNLMFLFYYYMYRYVLSTKPQISSVTHPRVTFRTVPHPPRPGSCQAYVIMLQIYFCFCPFSSWRVINRCWITIHLMQS